MDQDKYRIWVGVDQSPSEQVITALSAERKIVKKWKVAHQGAAIVKFFDELTELSGGEPERVAIGAESPHGALMEAGCERGFAMFHINPRQVERFRDRRSMSGAKDDDRDSEVIGDALATDLDKFRRIHAQDPQTVRLRELGRQLEELKRKQNRVENQLRECLSRYFPAALQLTKQLDEPWFVKLLQRAPTPEQAARLSVSTLQKLLDQQRIRRLTGKALHEVLQQQPLPLLPGTARAVSEQLDWLLPELNLHREQVGQVEKRVAQLLEQMSADPENPQHRDAQILLSLPGVGKCVGATMLGEAQELLQQRDYQRLRLVTGSAPVTKQSGRRQYGVSMRRACNVHLRNAVRSWAFTAIRLDPRTGQLYDSMRQRGHSYERALRGVADRLLNLLMAMLRDSTCYDPARRTLPAQAP